jgi:hypothetical protein
MSDTPLLFSHPLKKHRLFYYFLSPEERINSFLISYLLEEGLTYLASSPLAVGIDLFNLLLAVRTDLSRPPEVRIKPSFISSPFNIS